MNFPMTVGAQQLVFRHKSSCPSWPTIRAFHAPFYYSRSLYQLSYRGTNHENQRLTTQQTIFVRINPEHYTVFTAFVKTRHIFSSILQKNSPTLDIRPLILYTSGLAKLKWIAIRFDMELVLLRIQGNLRRNSWGFRSLLRPILTAA